ncbi:MAG: helix-turn-helix domain-containing protein [Anaerolineae bacterium]
MRQDDELTPIWKALSDPTRRTILDLLKERPRTTGELCAAFDELSRFAVMKHLSVLAEAELVIVRPNGRERWNHLNAVPLQQIYERWLRPYEARWASTLLQLKQYLEEPKGEKNNMAENPIGLQAIHIEQEVTITASPERVFEALTRDVAAWWGTPYLMAEAAQDIIFEPKLGGRFYEVWGEHEGVLYATVTGLKQAERLELTGPMGMGGAVHGLFSFELAPQAQGTLLRLSHKAFGEVTEETKANYSQGWQDLLGVRLKAFVETGERLGIRK